MKLYSKKLYNLFIRSATHTSVLCSETHACVSNNCGYRKRSRHCGPGCECQGCVNLPIEEATANNSVDETSDEETHYKKHRKCTVASYKQNFHTALPYVYICYY